EWLQQTMFLQRIQARSNFRLQTFIEAFVRFGKSRNGSENFTDRDRFDVDIAAGNSDIPARLEFGLEPIRKFLLFADTKNLDGLNRVLEQFFCRIELRLIRLKFYA